VLQRRVEGGERVVLDGYERAGGRLAQGASDKRVEPRGGARLKRKIDVRSVAAKLRRMARGRQIHRIREGRSFHESLYRRGPGG
jgi:hypothetical protein